jgi:anti-sigma B factor antagonist
MQVLLAEKDDVLLAKPMGRWLDAAAGNDLKERVGGEIQRGALRVVLDMSAVAHLDSAGLGSLIQLMKQLPAGGRIALYGCQPSVTELLTRAKLNPLLPSYPAEADAVAAVRGEAELGGR